jgi:hypothetical protein
MLDERTQKAEEWHHNAATREHLLNTSLKVEQAFHKPMNTSTNP